MRRKLSRPVLFATLAGALLVLGAAGVVLKDPLVERWMIYRLEAGDPAERAIAVEWLGHRGSARAVPALIGALGAREEIEQAAVDLKRRASIPGFTHPIRLDVPELPAAGALRKIIERSPAEGSRALAREVLRKGAVGHFVRETMVRLGARALPALPELMRVLGGDDDFAWDVVPPILGAIGPPARVSLPLLIGRLEEAESEAGSVQLARIVGNLAVSEDVPALLMLLEATQPRVRRAALWALDRMGPNATAAVTRLEACLGDADEEVRVLAMLALGSVRGE